MAKQLLNRHVSVWLMHLFLSPKPFRHHYNVAPPPPPSKKSCNVWWSIKQAAESTTTNCFDQFGFYTILRSSPTIPWFFDLTRYPRTSSLRLFTTSSHSAFYIKLSDMNVPFIWMICCFAWQQEMPRLIIGVSLISLLSLWQFDKASELTVCLSINSRIPNTYNR